MNSTIGDLTGTEPAVQQVASGIAETLVASRNGWVAAICGLVSASERNPTIVATATTDEAESLAADLSAFSRQTFYCPPWETLPFESISPTPETMGARLRVRHLLANPSSGLTVVAPIKALLQILTPAEAAKPIKVTKDSDLDQGSLVSSLVAMGYVREPQVVRPGDFAVRGSIVDVFASTQDSPVRLDFWGDHIDRITLFSPATQLSINETDDVEIFGCRELLPTKQVVEIANEHLLYY